MVVAASSSARLRASPVIPVREPKSLVGQDAGDGATSVHLVKCSRTAARDVTLEELVRIAPPR